MKLDRFERIILDTIKTWEWNRREVLKEEGKETFDLDELLDVIGSYGPWTSHERELPLSATLRVLHWFEREGIIKKIADELWEILPQVKGWGNGR